MNTATSTLSDRLRERAQELGFELVGLAPVRPSEQGSFYRRWLAEGRHGEMAYLAREDAVAARLDPARAWPGVASVVVLGHNYYQEDDGGVAANAASESSAAPAAAAITTTAPGGAADASRGIISRYARGRDYHKIIKKKLLQLLEWLEGEVGHELPLARAYVDTGPVFERELARRAGLGWQGQNTMLISPRRGSYFFLASLLVELELEYDEPFTESRCGSCSRCVEACPTEALLGWDEGGAPVIDATRCISYLTIEQRGEIPRELRPLIGNRIFGCDICQEVCPFSRKFSKPTAEPAFAARAPGEPPFGVAPLAGDVWHPGTASPSLVQLMAMDEMAWESFSRGSPVRRAGRAGFLRNVAVALGNWGSPEAVPALASALSDPEPLVRSHAAWALGCIGSAEACRVLEEHLAVESDSGVREEIESALES
jgi:epoxyqueuosine reductase